MQWTRSGLPVCAAVVALLIVVGCGGGGRSAQEQQRESEWTWLSDTKQELDGKRQQLAALKAAAEEARAEEAGAEEAEAEPVEGEEIEAGQAVADTDTQIKQLEEEIASLTEEFTDRLVAYINADPMIEGEEPTERQIAAMRMKSDEDILLAKEWIERGGDYKRAIEIYNTALMFDPDNEALKVALAEAEADRYMSEERFSQVGDGMNRDEVRKLLGQVNLHNIREYPDKEVEAWFYPTAADGSAAAVWFQPDKDGELRVYQAKFEAVKPGEQAEGG